MHAVRPTLDRRTLLAAAGGFAASGMATAQASPVRMQPEGTTAERAAMAAAAHAFMANYDVPGLSVAIARGGNLAYREAFGVADRETGERLTSAHLFRIASVSKPITAIAIFTLIEQGRLRLSDRVFGPTALLGFAPAHPWLTEITVEHLLTHTAGGWPNDDTDPMFREPSLNHTQLIAWTLRSLPLRHRPGTNFAYSNFGYCLLGRIAEKIAGMPYPAFAREAVLTPSGVEDMWIAGDTLAQRRKLEVRYHGRDGANPYALRVARMDSHGGWIAHPTDMARIAMHVDGFQTTPNILRPATIQAMTAPNQVDPGYARGWRVNAVGNWWHTGSLAGTATIVVRTRSGFVWAAFTNTRVRSSGQARDLDRLVWDMTREVAAWRA